MEHVNYLKELITIRKVESFTLTKDIAIVSVMEIVNNVMSTSEIFFYHPDEVKNLIDISSKDFNLNRHKFIMHKYKSLYVSRQGFKEAYKTAIYGSDEFYNLDKLFFTPVQLFNWCLGHTNVDTSSFEYSYYDSYTGIYYPFIYSASPSKYRSNEINSYVHPIKFNDYCYMLTDKDYDLEKIAEYIKPEIEAGRIIVSSNDDEIIQNIPYYNRGSGYIKYINFYVVTDSDNKEDIIESYKNKFMSFATPKYLEEIRRSNEIIAKN